MNKRDNDRSEVLSSFTYENHCRSIRLLINLLFGLNRIYYPSFKWTRYFIERMTITPTHFFARMERVFQSEPINGTQEL